MEHLIEFGVFFGKVAVVVVAIAAIVALVAAIALKSKHLHDQLEIENINKKFDRFAQLIKSVLLDKKQFKSAQKKKKKDKKEKSKSKLTQVFILEFNGDIKASAVEQLRDEITAIISVANKNDEVILVLESPGGVVHGYGLAASQLLRLKNHKLKLTICVDKVAASGGYLMACTADQILAAPFAIIGSIGVLAQVPNFNRLLKKHDVDYQEITAGEYKRTLSLMGEITEKGKQKFTEQIEDTHKLFKEFVQSQRPQVEINKVGTGEYWFGTRAIDLKLIDEIKTSDEYIYESQETKRVYKLSLQAKKKFMQKVSEAMSIAVERGAEKFWERMNQSPPF